MVRLFIFSLLIISGGVLLSRAWFDSVAQSSQGSSATFTPQDVPLDEEVVGAGVDADQLLQKAIGNLAATGSGWLRTKIRQTMFDGNGRFTAEGFLQRGPNHCARLEIEIGAGETGHSLLIVSDGEVLAQIHKQPGTPPNAQVEKLPDATGQGPANEDYLLSHGCGGPLPQLRQFRTHLKDARLQTGMLGEHAVIRIQGDMDPAPLPSLARLKSPSLRAFAYLDAVTLWPRRFEWRGEGHRLLQIDFLDGEVGNALSVEECTRVFSYQATGHEQFSAR